VRFGNTPASEKDGIKDKGLKLGSNGTYETPQEVTKKKRAYLTNGESKSRATVIKRGMRANTGRRIPKDRGLVIERE